MVKIIMGLNGSGKTRKLVDMVRESLNNGAGDVIVVENENKLTYDIPYQARLIDISEHGPSSYAFIKGFICGVRAGNYDIAHFYIDNFNKLVEDKSSDSFCIFVKWLEEYSAKENIEFVICTSGDPEYANEAIKPYIIK